MILQPVQILTHGQSTVKIEFSVNKTTLEENIYQQLKSLIIMLNITCITKASKFTVLNQSD